jgi:hypothetical protein
MFLDNRIQKKYYEEENKGDDNEKVLLYFHGNAEDLYMSIDLLF